MSARTPMPAPERVSAPARGLRSDHVLTSRRGLRSDHSLGVRSDHKKPGPWERRQKVVASLLRSKRGKLIASSCEAIECKRVASSSKAGEIYLLNQATTFWIDQAYALAQLWQRSRDVAFGRKYSWPLLTSRDPFTGDGDKKQERRWADAIKLAVWLDEQHIPADEFCTALAEYGKWQAKQRGVRSFATTMRQYRNQQGREIWARWRRWRVAEGAGTPMRVECDVRLHTQSRDEKLIAAIRHAYTICNHEGVRGVSFTWEPETLYLLATTEPYITTTLADVIRRASEETRAWLKTEFQRCARYRTELLLLKQKALGSALAQLNWPCAGTGSGGAR